MGAGRTGAILPAGTGPRLPPSAIEGCIVANGSDMQAVLFANDAELRIWADGFRRALERDGWTPVPTDDAFTD